MQGGERGAISLVGLGQQQPVRHRHLAHGFVMAIQLPAAQHRVHRGDDAIQLVPRGDPAATEQGIEDRRRVGDAGGLDEDALIGR